MKHNSISRTLERQLEAAIKPCLLESLRFHSRFSFVMPRKIFEFYIRELSIAPVMSYRRSNEHVCNTNAASIVIEDTQLFIEQLLLNMIILVNFDTGEIVY